MNKIFIGSVVFIMFTFLSCSEKINNNITDSTKPGDTNQKPNPTAEYTLKVVINDSTADKNATVKADWSGGSGDNQQLQTGVKVVKGKEVTVTLFNPSTDNISWDIVTPSADKKSAKITMDSDKTLTITVSSNPIAKYTLTTSVITGGTIEVKVGGELLSGNSSYQIEDGKSVTLTAKPNKGYNFSKFTGTDIVAGDETKNPAVIVMDKDKNIEASFAVIQTFTLTLNYTYKERGVAEVKVDGEILTGETVGDNTKYTIERYKSVTISAKPNEDFKFSYYNIDGKNDPSSDVKTFTMDNDKTVGVTFQYRTVKLTIKVIDKTSTIKNVRVSVTTGITSYEKSVELNVPSSFDVSVNQKITMDIESTDFGRNPFISWKGKGVTKTIGQDKIGYINDGIRENQDDVVITIDKNSK